jgi:Plant protein of unknown function (DUF639)
MIHAWKRKKEGSLSYFGHCAMHMIHNLLSHSYFFRDWIRYIIPFVFFCCAVFMLWNKHHRKGRPIEAFQVAPPRHKSTVEQLLTLQETISKLEMSIQEGNITLLKLRAILFAAFPQVCEKSFYFHDTSFELDSFALLVCTSSRLHGQIQSIHHLTDMVSINT